MVIALAEMPNRATTSFTLSWGLVSIPVSAYTGTEQTRVTRKEFTEIHKHLVEVGRASIRKDNGEVIDNAAVGRYALADSGEWVILTDEEIAECTSPKGVAEIVSFVPVKDVGNYLAENQSQVRPRMDKGKVNPGADRAFALLMAGMKASKVVALIKVAMRGPARYGLLAHDGTFTLIYTADAIRQARPVTADYKFSKDELGMASALIEAVGIDTPTVTDDTAPEVQEYVNSKATGKKFTKAEPAIPTVDLAAALSASIDAAKAAKAKTTKKAS
jgi:DNA end-binding protein Ku